ncbi:MAG: cob(I)yrinic acid a,c-diamide adenosyltransferase [Anaerolineae bacterium]
MGLKRGLVQVYTGEGKGKTTAALGLAMRAAGHGLKVYIIQFMKGWPNYGELKTVGGHPQITLRQFGRPEFVDPDKPEPLDREMAQEALREARRVLTSGSYDLVILDEVNVALKYGLIELRDVLALIEEKPKHLELVLTGRYAPPEVIERADLVTEMREVKHPYRIGIEGQEGIEY